MVIPSSSPTSKERRERDARAWLSQKMVV
ncbi:hypothetical protein HID58_073906, partial [Brassica napus]